MRVSPQDKLRTLLGAKVGRHNHFLRAELAEILGISARTLRRIANVKGYQVSARTLAKIKQPLDRENRNFRRFIKDKIIVPVTTRSRGRTRITYTLQKIVPLRMPTLPVQPIPISYTSKSGRSRTIKIDCDLWSAQQKIDYLISAANSGRFSSWSARVKVPVGVATSGDEESFQVNDEERAQYYMIGPFELGLGHRTIKHMEKDIIYHEDAGRIIVDISIVENAPDGKRFVGGTGYPQEFVAYPEDDEK